MIYLLNVVVWIITLTICTVALANAVKNRDVKEARIMLICILVIIFMLFILVMAYLLEEGYIRMPKITFGGFRSSISHFIFLMA